MTPKELMERVREEWKKIDLEAQRQLQDHTPRTCVGCNLLNPIHDTPCIQSMAAAILSQMVLKDPAPAYSQHGQEVPS